MSDERTQYLVERLVEGRITEDEQNELDAARTNRPEVDRLIAAERELRAIIADARNPEFKPFFEQRVMKRLEEEYMSSARQSEASFFDVDLSAALARLFPRVAMPAFAVSALAMASNAAAATPGVTLTEALFALPTIDAALAMIV